MTSFDEDMTAQLDAYAPSLPRPAAEQVPRVVPPVTEAEMKSAQTANLALGITGHLRSTGDTVTLEALAWRLGEDADRLRPALELAAKEGKVEQVGEAYRAKVNGGLGGWSTR